MSTEIIEEWLNVHTIKKAKPKERLGVIQRVTDMIDSLPEQYHDGFKNEVDATKIWLKKQDEFHANDVDNEKIKTFLKSKIKVNDMVSRYVIAFLLVNSRINELDQLRSFYFFTCLNMVQLKDYDSRIKKTLDECRYLSEKTRSFLIKFLPEPDESEDILNFRDNLTDQIGLNHYRAWSNFEDKNKDYRLQTLSLEKFGKKVQEKAIKESRDDDTSLDIEHLVNNKIDDYLKEFILPIDNVLKRKSGITRQIGKRHHHRVIHLEGHHDEVTGNQISSLTMTAESNNLDGFEAHERIDDDNKAHDKVTLKNPTNYHTDIIRAEQQVDATRQRTMSHKTDTQVAHEFDIECLLQSIIEAITLTELNVDLIEDYSENTSVDDLYRDAKEVLRPYLVILLSLLIGQDAINVIDKVDKHPHFYFIELSFEPDRARQHHDWNEEILKTEERIRRNTIVVLTNYVGKLMQIAFDEMTNEEKTELPNLIKDCLNNINERYGIRLTKRKIQTYMPHYLINKGYDHALIDVMTDKPINHKSALPYYNINQSDISSCQYAYNQHLTDLVEDKINDNSVCQLLFDLPDEKVINIWIRNQGSLLAVPTYNLEPIVTSLSSQVDSARKLFNYNNSESVVSYHNSIMDYLYLMLSISTGYRAVNEPFGRLEHFDCGTGFYFISDKEMIVETRGRFIYLPKIACQQLEFFTQYLNSTQIILSRLQNPLSQIYQDILTSQRGIVTYFKQSEDGIIEPDTVNQSLLQSRMKNIIGLPLNWHRHFIRSLKNGYNGIYSMSSNMYQSTFNGDSFAYDTIGAWMGHSDEMGYSFFDRYSGDKTSQLKRFADYLDNLLQKIGFTAIEFARG